jgi:hypothetical protein
MPTTAQMSVEQMMQRRATAEFISAHPIAVRIRRTTTHRDLSTRGGTVVTHHPELPEQVFRIAHGPPRRRRLENNPPHPQHAEIAFAKDLLIGPWHADIQIGDEFDVDDIGYRVSYVFQDRDYETVANIESLTQAHEEL